MATANDVVDGALRKISVLAAGESLSNEDAQDTLTALNEMLHGLELQGIFLGHTDLTLTDTVNLPDSHIEGVKAMLAVRIAPEFEKQAPQTVIAMAAEAEGLLISHYLETRPMDIDAGLRVMPSQSWGRTGSYE